jgi:hypothetical protein
MKMLAKLTMVLVVLGFCLPSFGEILVYKFTETDTYFQQEGEQWEVRKETNKGYIIVEVNYDDYTITQAEGIGYWKDDEGKWFKQNPVDLELVRVTYDSKVQWVIMEKEVELDGEELVGVNFVMLAGKAGNKNIGVEEAKEVASSLSGYILEDTTQDAGRSIQMSSKITLTLYPSWTYWANGDEEDEGNKNFEATKQMIKAYLTKKGYTKESE